MLLYMPILHHQKLLCKYQNGCYNKFSIKSQINFCALLGSAANYVILNQLNVVITRAEMKTFFISLASFDNKKEC